VPKETTIGSEALVNCLGAEGDVMGWRWDLDRRCNLWLGKMEALVLG
jgi:hypothetical protein